MHCRTSWRHLLGFEAALFVPSGTQSNLCAHPGALPARVTSTSWASLAHTYRWEGGGAAVLGSVQPQPLSTRVTALALADIEAAIKPDDAHYASTRLLDAGKHLGGQTAAF
jgi:threonine aldolase